MAFLALMLGSYPRFSPSSEHWVKIENRIYEKAKKQHVQVGMSEAYVQHLEKNNIRHIVVKTWMDKDITDLIDSFMKARQVFLDLTLEEWVKAIKLFKKDEMLKMWICGEDLTIQDNLNSYLLSKLI